MLYDKRWDAKVETKQIEEWREVLLRAADIVRARGLAKWTQMAQDGSVCIQGAISLAATGAIYGNGPLYCRASTAVKSHLVTIGASMPVRDVHGYGNANWNNKPERTADEVIAVLETAART